MTWSARRASFGFVVAILVLIAGSLAVLEPEQLARFAVSPAGLTEVLPTTLWAAARVWVFWGCAGMILAGLLERADPTLGRHDSLLGGFVGVWIFAWLAANLLGPIGLYWAGPIWTLLAVGLVWIIRHSTQVERTPWLPGQRLALLAFGLLAPTALLLQLGVPVPTYMDILATPAAAQRIMTFGYYLPFDSDPYGYWTISSQLPGLEPFYALLGFGSGVELGLLADTAAILPMLALLIWATHRLGVTVADDRTAGFACLFLMATVLPRVLPYGHGRSVAFVLVATGLAFLFDARRSVVRTTLGAVALATAFAAHAGVGLLALAVATLGARNAGLWLGLALLAVPTVAVLTGTVLPYPVLPLAQAAGVMAVAVGAWRWRPARPVGWWGALPLLACAVALLWHPAPYVLGNNHAVRFPLLVYAGGLGFAVAMFDRRRPLLVVALGTAIALVLQALYVEGGWHAYVAHDPRAEVGLTSLFYKLDYWLPYLLVFPAGYLAAWVATWTTRRVAVFAVLILLIFPWRERLYPTHPGAADPNSDQHALVELWAYQTENGLSGFWGGTTGSRQWAQGPAEMDAFAVLRAEVAAGRITTATHLALLAPFTYLFKDNFLAAVYTGINVDGYITRYRFDNSIAGSRLRPIEEWPARLASDPPPYIAVHVRVDPNDPENVDPTPFVGALPGYDEIFNRDGIRLLRRMYD